MNTKKCKENVNKMSMSFRPFVEADFEEILSMIYQEEDLEFTCNKLIQAANEKGGYDNISVILAQNVEAGKESPIL